MAPRRAAAAQQSRDNDGQGNAGGRRGAAANASRRQARQGPQSDDEDDDAFSSMDIVSACMEYSTEVEKKINNRARKFLEEAERIAAEYQDKTEEILLNEQQELNTLYEEHREEGLKDLEEREAIVRQLADNYEKIKHLSKVMLERNVLFETKRMTRTVACLDKADTNANHYKLRTEELLAQRESLL